MRQWVSWYLAYAPQYYDSCINMDLPSLPYIKTCIWQHKVESWVARHLRAARRIKPWFCSVFSVYCIGASTVNQRIVITHYVRRKPWCLYIPCQPSTWVSAECYEYTYDSFQNVLQNGGDMESTLEIVGIWLEGDWVTTWYVELRSSSS